MSKSNTDEWLKEVVELAMLYDFYGELLSDSAKKVFEGYVLDDMSLSEISEETGVSRQGIHDTVRRTQKKLYEYENKLHLVEKFNNVKNDIARIRKLAIDIKNRNDDQRSLSDNVEEILRLSQELLDSY